MKNVIYNNINTENENETVILDDLLSNDTDNSLTEINRILSQATKEIRSIIPSHQSAIALIVDNKWSQAHTYISLSDKYNGWKDYAVKAASYGIHRYILQCHETIRLSQAEFEAHLEDKGFGEQIGGHPPLRGWLASPLKDLTGTTCGMIQLSDRTRSEYSKEDERMLEDYVNRISWMIE